MPKFYVGVLFVKFGIFAQHFAWVSVAKTTLFYAAVMRMITQNLWGLRLLFIVEGFSMLNHENLFRKNGLGDETGAIFMFSTFFFK